MNDKFDEQAETLLPCQCGDYLDQWPLHRGWCANKHRSAVAAALREQLAEARKIMDSHSCATKMGMYTLTPCGICAWLTANREGK